MSDSSQIHRGFMALSCHFHGTFLSASQLCRLMSLSWQFHGTFTYKPYLGTVCQNLLEKLSKKSVLVVDLFFLPNFSFIFGNMSDSCRFHGLAWHFHGAFFLLIFIVFPNSFMALAWQIHGAFMALSWPFLALFPFGHFCICHENAMKVP